LQRISITINTTHPEYDIFLFHSDMKLCPCRWPQ